MAALFAPQELTNLYHFQTLSVVLAHIHRRQSSEWQPEQLDESHRDEVQLSADNLDVICKITGKVRLGRIWKMVMSSFQIQVKKKGTHVSVSPKARSNMSFSSSVGSSSLLQYSTSCTKFKSWHLVNGKQKPREMIV